MKKNQINMFSFAVIFLLFLGFNTGCRKASDAVSTDSQTDAENIASVFSPDGFKGIILNSNKPVYGGQHINGNLKNAWGMSADDEGEIWVSAADGGVSFVYNNKGGQIMPAVNIPSHESGAAGNPTGNLYNETTDFVIPGTNEKSEFIFASEDGTISAWNDPAGSSAIIVADRSAKGASYKGIAMAQDGGANFLYVTNFAKKRIDVLDKNFNYVSGRPFRDADLPAGYAPFNIYNVEGKLFVTYALQTADGEEDSTGDGLGIVDVYQPDGSMLTRFASHGSLNAPWGIADVSGNFAGIQHAILIGNFGDGHISVFDRNGNLLGQLMNNGKPISIQGLWAINAEIPGAKPNQLYFTAGPNGESDGIFGVLEKE